MEDSHVAVLRGWGHVYLRLQIDRMEIPRDSANTVPGLVPGIAHIYIQKGGAEGGGFLGLEDNSLYYAH